MLLGPDSLLALLCFGIERGFPVKRAVTLLFPGQGSQYVGMGRIFEGESGQQWRERVDRAVDAPLSQLMLEGPEEELTLTANAQPAIVAHSLIFLEKLKEKLKSRLATGGVEIQCVLGHSVGEYAALCAAGVLNFEDTLKAVRWRGQLMQEAVPVGEGGMVAVTKVPCETVTHACESCSRPNSVVAPANYNSPEQTVISGHKEACQRVVEWLEREVSGPHRCIPLKVSAPFHSVLMVPVAEGLKERLAHLTSWASSRLPYVANVDAKTYFSSTDANTIRENLYLQVTGPVLWTQSMQQLPRETLCVEVGPGKVLTGLARREAHRVKVIPLDREGAFGELERALEEATEKRV